MLPKYYSNSSGKSKVFYHGKLKESVHKYMRHWQQEIAIWLHRSRLLISPKVWHDICHIFGNGCRNRNFRKYISATVRDAIEIPTTQNENIDVLGANFAVSGCPSFHNNLATLLSSSSYSKMPDLPFEFQRCRSEFQIYNWFRFRPPFPVVGHY